MAKSKRNIGLEILQNLREIKPGEHGRKTTLPAMIAARKYSAALRER
jgi:hypothetical protein